MVNARSQGLWQRRSPTLVTLAIVSLAFVFLYAAKPVLIPTALAILLSFLLGPVVAFLRRRGIPRVLAVLIVVGSAGVAVSLIVWLFVAQSLLLVNDLPKYQARIAERIEEVRGDESQPSMFGKVQSFVDRVVHAATGARNQATARSKPPQPVVVVNSNQTMFATLRNAVRPLLAPIAVAGLVVILLIYMLVEREELRDRVVRLCGRGRIPLTTMAIDDASRRISRYLLAQFIINLSFGTFIAVGLTLIGVPYAILWGILSAFLRYIPIIGPWLSAILPVSLSFLTATGWTQPILAILLFAVFELVANLWIEPWIYGHTMGISQAALLIAIAFWTWLWGPMGLVLAAPMTVCLMILGRYVPALKFFDILLGDEPPLTMDLRFYQRLLAHNQDEASQLVREQLTNQSLREVYDEVIVPALKYARRDMESGRLSSSDAEQVWENSAEIAEELGFAASTTAPAADSAATTTAIAVDPLPRIRVLVCAARDRGDSVASEMLARIANPAICEVETVSADRLAGEIVSKVEEVRPSVVCIAALPPGGLARTRLLCKRLRGQHPKLKILVGRWGLEENVDRDREELVNAGADLMGVSLEETNHQLAQLAQYLRPGFAERDSDNDRESSSSTQRAAAH